MMRAMHAHRMAQSSCCSVVHRPEARPQKAAQLAHWVPVLVDFSIEGRPTGKGGPGEHKGRPTRAHVRTGGQRSPKGRPGLAAPAAFLPMLRLVALLLLQLLLTLSESSAGSAAPPAACDVLIAGGSTAALSAALTSAAAAPTLHICLTEPTDELGGQLGENTSATPPATT